MFIEIEKVLKNRSKSSFKPAPLKAAFICDQGKKITERILKRTLSVEIVFRYKNRALLIKAPNTWAYELELHRDQIEEALKDRFGKHVISEVKIRAI